MYESRDKYIPRKHHADYKERERGNWGTTETRKIEWFIAVIYLYIFIGHDQNNPLCRWHVYVVYIIGRYILGINPIRIMASKDDLTEH